MDNERIYENLSDFNLGDRITELEKEKGALKVHIQKLEEDVEKLCQSMIKMKRENDVLAKNISELFKTAKREMERKDQTIENLRNQVDDLLFKRNRNEPDRSRFNNMNIVSNKHCFDERDKSKEKFPQKIKSLSRSPRRPKSRSQSPKRFKGRGISPLNCYQKNARRNPFERPPPPCSKERYFRDYRCDKFKRERLNIREQEQKQRFSKYKIDNREIKPELKQKIEDKHFIDINIGNSNSYLIREFEELYNEHVDINTENPIFPKRTDVQNDDNMLDFRNKIENIKQTEKNYKLFEINLDKNNKTQRSEHVKPNMETHLPNSNNQIYLEDKEEKFGGKSKSTAPSEPICSSDKKKENIEVQSKNTFKIKKENDKDVSQNKSRENCQKFELINSIDHDKDNKIPGSINVKQNVKTHLPKNSNDQKNVDDKKEKFKSTAPSLPSCSSEIKEENMELQSKSENHKIVSQITSKEKCAKSEIISSIQEASSSKENQESREENSSTLGDNISPIQVLGRKRRRCVIKIVS